MNEETLNLSLRKFLKKVGVTAQRHIETTLRTESESGGLSGRKSIPVSVRLRLDGVGEDLIIEGEIEFD